MRGGDARASLHRHHRLDRHRHVDQNAVGLLDAFRLERVSEVADLVVELLVGDLRHLAVIGFEDDRGLVRLGLRCRSRQLYEAFSSPSSNQRKNGAFDSSSTC